MKKITIVLLFLVFVACGGGDRSVAQTQMLESAVPATPAAVDTGIPFASVDTRAFRAGAGSFDMYMVAEASEMLWMADYDGWIIPEEPVSTPVPAPAERFGDVVAPAPAAATRHIIRNAQLELETYYFDTVMDILREIPFTVAGYIERSSMNTSARRAGRADVRSFRITMRVPVAQFDAILAQVEALAAVVSSSQTAQDVTDQFYDMQTRLDTRLIEEDRILHLIEYAESLSEILDLEQRLSAVRLQIGRYQSSLNNLIQQTTYSTINVVLWELIEEDKEYEEEEEYIPAPPTFGDRIGGAFASSWGGTMHALQDFAVFMAGAFIPLAVLGFVVFLVYKAYVRYRAI